MARRKTTERAGYMIQGEILVARMRIAAWKEADGLES